jgi:hypothetical protein
MTQLRDLNETESEDLLNMIGAATDQPWSDRNEDISNETESDTVTFICIPSEIY